MAEKLKDKERPDDREDDLPAHEDVHAERDGGGVTVDLDALPGAKKEERGTKKGGEDRTAEHEETGALDALVEDRDPGIREKRREERKARKEERVRRERQIETENTELRERLAALEQGRAQDQQRGVRDTVGRLETEMETLQRQYEEAKKLKKTAYENKDGESAVSADEAMAAARERYNELNSQRSRIIVAAQSDERRPRVSEALQTNARKFMSDHDWYDIKGGDRDSAKVLALDRQLANEGWDPNTAGYWAELAERVKEEIPHRFEEDGAVREEVDRERPRQRQRTGGADRDTPANAGNTFYLSAARVAALKEAGMWEDPAKRAKMIRTYKTRDEQEAQRAKLRR